MQENSEQLDDFELSSSIMDVFLNDCGSFVNGFPDNNDNNEIVQCNPCNLSQPLIVASDQYNPCEPCDTLDKNISK